MVSTNGTFHFNILPHMTLFYIPSTKLGSLRTIHNIVIDGKELKTTRAKEVLIFAKPLIYDKIVWRELKDAVRLGNTLEVRGGGILS